jgi:hypothetical protein
VKFFSRGLYQGGQLLIEERERKPRVDFMIPTFVNLLISDSMLGTTVITFNMHLHYYESNDVTLYSGPKNLVYLVSVWSSENMKVL